MKQPVREQVPRQGNGLPLVSDCDVWPTTVSRSQQSADGKSVDISVTPVSPLFRLRVAA